MWNKYVAQQKYKKNRASKCQTQCFRLICEVAKSFDLAFRKII